MAARRRGVRGGVAERDSSDVASGDDHLADNNTPQHREEEEEPLWWETLLHEVLVGVLVGGVVWWAWPGLLHTVLAPWRPEPAETLEESVMHRVCPPGITCRMPRGIHIHVIISETC